MIKIMKFSGLRQHKTTNANTDRMLQEYHELMRLGQENRAEVLRRRLVKRYGKECLEPLTNEHVENDRRD